MAIVGAGFTGLNAALALARDHGLDVRVLEPGAPGFGASGRNGGFCCLPATKIGFKTIARRYGETEAKRFGRAQRDAVAHVRELLDALAIDAETHSHGGELALAHSAEAYAAFAEEAEEHRRYLEIEPTLYPKEALRQLGAEGPGFHGAMIEPIGFALHPLRYLRGLADACVAAGVRIHARTEATSIAFGAPHRVTTPRGAVAADRLLIATNGYSAETSPDWLGGRLLPALSSVLVTRPISAEERRAQGFTTDFMAYDSRRLLHYFRLLPDGRFLFGGRGGTSAAPAGLARFRRRLRRDFEAMFPAWAHVETTHEWSGLVALTRARTPYIGPIGAEARAWTALAFHGNGVATGSWAGAQLARLAAGTLREEELPALFRTPLRRFPAPALRRTYLKAAYLWYGLLD